MIEPKPKPGEINLRIVDQAAAAIQAGDAKRLGELMVEAQEEFDRYAMPACQSQLTSPKLHALLADPALHPFSWGGKGVGSQGDGCAQFVARSKEAQGKIVQARFHAFACNWTVSSDRPKVFPCGLYLAL